MIILENESLARHTTIKIGGIAKKYFIPQNTNELSELLQTNSDYNVISGGSNILIDDKKNFPCVIDMKSCCKEFNIIEDNKIYVGSSLRIQNVIRLLQDLDFGGFEFLSSLPALFGGIIVMNAGRGSDGKSINHFIEKVKYMDLDGQIHWIENEKCEFSYRKSIFQRKRWIVLGAVIKCERIPKNQSQQLVVDRIEHCKLTQDLRFPNFGSVFSRSNPYIMGLLMIKSKFSVNRSGAMFSDKSKNWIINSGDGTFEQAMKNIRLAQKIHKIAGKECKIEVKIWE